MAPSTSQILDAHVHIWQPSRFHYHWLPKGSTLDREFLLEHVREEMQSWCVVGGILMEATNTPDEIAWLLQVSESTEGIWGVIGWVPLEHADAAEQVAEFARHSRFKGVRLNWLEARRRTDSRDAAMRAISRDGLVVDILAHGEQLSAIADFIRIHPNVSFVLEHFGGVAPDASNLMEWRTTMCLFASLSNVVVKLSGYTASPDSALSLFVHTALDLFGANRLMFGSNFPICLQAASYSDTIAALHRIPMSETEKRHVFFETAQRVYKLW